MCVGATGAKKTAKPDQNSQSTNNKQQGGLKIKQVLKGRSNLSSVMVKTHTHTHRELCGYSSRWECKVIKEHAKKGHANKRPCYAVPDELILTDFQQNTYNDRYVITAFNSSVLQEQINSECFTIARVSNLTIITFQR